ncbi:3-methyl-2-oxobutanoate hydroxymethyltransferase [Acetobacter sp. TBRC 12305]|uniref:3-methyl-2-oxobutanoate hydroxymethyltransferase n=1 Tax=Acetobacter garciniae TaxID=2817435 RepID=A0A939HLN6_9PROT|nr:3-methyl-2-oxobutanoate hydroxymethyltransferase [Acetobacter garciniae]MBO1323823.1 3-methyl-2-oxobutanoate hydroxymethyltransferase [Acetobacter garciniae]MBX0343512.1 3-methyl-2-oxobutanoate hydroxymethyltransferase [Acetobacter garciniae]
MSKHQTTRRHTPRSLVTLQTPIVALTAYTTPMARLLDPHCDLLLVGDSLGMVVYGMDSTLAVTPEMMAAHGQAVVRGSQKACVAVDLPFGSYQESPQQAFRVAADIMARTGAGCVKLEGGREMADTIAFLVQRGIPVIGHIGLKPQAVHAHGGFRTVGRGAEATQIMEDAVAVEQAGAFAVVIESTMEPVARAISEKLSIPTIGIGASPACGGQVLVTEDMLGLFPDFTPRFVRRFANLGQEVDRAVAAYAQAVRSHSFPGPEECVGLTETP